MEPLTKASLFKAEYYDVHNGLLNPNAGTTQIYWHQMKYERSVRKASTNRGDNVKSSGVSNWTFSSTRNQKLMCCHNFSFVRILSLPVAMLPVWLFCSFFLTISGKIYNIQHIHCETMINLHWSQAVTKTGTDLRTKLIFLQMYHCKNKSNCLTLLVMATFISAAHTSGLPLLNSLINSSGCYM